MKPEYPQVSIGMPVYNSEKTIDRALGSLLAQRYPNFEIIISDNASGDKTADICSRYAQRDQRIRFYANPSNLGINANFKIVFKKASGKYFMWAASDDFWEPDFVETLVNELEADPLAGLAFCAVKRIYPDGNQRDIVQFNGIYNPNELSNFQVAASLLSPIREVKDLKYNLFVCGLFRHVALKGIFSTGDDVLAYGERALLAPLALAYRFRYMDKVLFVKTLYNESYKERNPDDDFVKAKKKLKYWEYYAKLIRLIMRSPDISWVHKQFVFVIFYYMVIRFTYKLKKKFPRKRES